MARAPTITVGKNHARLLENQPPDPELEPDESGL